MYPKPLTISRHTVAAVKTPLLSRRERLALVVQSRVHSRTGRLFATADRAACGSRRRRSTRSSSSSSRRRSTTSSGWFPASTSPPQARIASFVVIERGGSATTAACSPRRGRGSSSVENSEDAYGFPPYPAHRALPAQRNGRTSSRQNGRSSRARCRRHAGASCSAASRWTGGSASPHWPGSRSPGSRSRRPAQRRRDRGGAGSCRMNGAGRRASRRRTGRRSRGAFAAAAVAGQLAALGVVAHRPRRPRCAALVLAVFLRSGSSTVSASTATRLSTPARRLRSRTYPVFKPFFPVFRAHPLLFQTILSLGYRLGTGDLFARLLADLFGARHGRRHLPDRAGCSTADARA